MYGKLGSLKRVVGAHQAGWHGRWWRRAARKKAMDPQYIRNFCIIAHIDHGKSTLADRLLELTGALSQREMQAQVLDSMDLERERGITIKAKSIRLHYKAKDGHEYRLNLIDTPGHVDFSYEVSRAAFGLRRRAAGGGRQPGRGSADRGQRVSGVEAQPGNYSGDQQDRFARGADRFRQRANRKRAGHSGGRCAADQRESGPGVEEVLEAIVRLVPPPKGSADAPLRALIFDSWFDPYRGAVVLARVMEGRITPNMKIRLSLEQRSVRSGNAGGADAEAGGAARSWPRAMWGLSSPTSSGWPTRGWATRSCRMAHPAPPLAGFEAIKPMVFAGLFPVNAQRLRNAARCAGQTAAERRGVFLRAGKFGGAGFWVSLRISRACCTWRSCRSGWSANSTLS